MSRKKNDWKNREGIVYSTQSDFDYTENTGLTPVTRQPAQQHLKVGLDTSGRAGKQVTLISGFAGSTDDLERLSKMLKSGCGVGGSAKDGAILLQGDLRDKAVALLQAAGYKAKRSG
jgi:translation initiation factor 1